MHIWMPTRPRRQTPPYSATLRTHFLNACWLDLGCQGVVRLGDRPTSLSVVTLRVTLLFEQRRKLCCVCCAAAESAGREPGPVTSCPAEMAEVPPRRVCVFGSGSFGTAMATVAARNGFDVVRQKPVPMPRPGAPHCSRVVPSRLPAPLLQ